VLADVPGDKQEEAAEVVAGIKEGLENLAKVMSKRDLLMGKRDLLMSKRDLLMGKIDLLMSKRDLL